MEYDEWQDQMVADSLKDLPDGIYQKNKEGKLVRYE